MLKRRIIPTLLLRNGRMVKGSQFSKYRDTGDPIFASRVYNSQYVDELTFIDIDATNSERETNSEIIERVSRECFMPLTIGGGIKSIETIRKLLLSGADKVIINTAAYGNPDFIRDACKHFGSQCIVIGIDVRRVDDGYELSKNSGTEKCDIDLLDHLRNVQEWGAGEIFLNDITSDGMMQGYDIDLINKVVENSKVPVVACGGAGNLMHLVDAFKKTKVSGLGMASIFHFGDNNPIRARAYLMNNQIEIKKV